MHQLCVEIINGNNVRENLILLNKQIKEDKNFDVFLDIYYENEDLFKGLIAHDDPKVRKNVIKLFSRIADEELFELLFESYKNENTQFLKSDYLSAFEAFDYKEHLDYFKERKEILEKEERTKHSIEEMRSLMNLIWKLVPPKKHVFSSKEEAEKLLLVVPRGHEAVVMEELQSIPNTQAKALAGGCAVLTKNLEQVCRVRTYQAVLFDFYPSTIPSQDGKVIGESMIEHGVLDYILKHHNHKENAPFIFRVDVKGIADVAKKNQLAKSLSLCLEEKSNGMLFNDSSYYEFEIRVIAGSKGCRVFLKFSTLPDGRFAYRKYTMSTSMQPSKAALLMRYLKPYMKQEANVLDPFCGTGTLLIERAFTQPVKSLYGLDISGPAIQAAWENSQRAGKLLNLVQRNFNDFRHEYKFDEIITDMPRLSANMKQKQLEDVYRLLFLRSRELMSDDGVLAVYCEDEYMMERCLKENPWLKRCKKVTMTKEKTSFIYILQKMYS